MRYLVDIEAFENTPAIWQAALRQKGDCTEYTHIWTVGDIDFSILGTARRQGLSVLTTPDRVSLWEPVINQDCTLLRWALERYGVSAAKARELAKKDQEVLLRSKTWVNQGKWALDGVRVIQEAPDISFEWTHFQQEVGQPEGRTDQEYETVNFGNHLLDLATWRRVHPHTMIALDFETQGEYPLQEVVGFSFSTELGRAVYVPLWHTKGTNAPHGPARKLLREITSGPWVAHNAIFEYHCLLNLGITPAVLPEDTMLLAWLAGQEKSLKKLAKELLGEEMETFVQVTKGKQSIAEVSIERTTQYACADADFCLRILPLLEPDLDVRRWSWGNVYEQIDRPLIPILAAMERRGIRVDVPWLEQWEKELVRETEGIRDTILALAGLGVEADGVYWYTDEGSPVDSHNPWAKYNRRPTPNLNSHDDVQWLLFTHLGLEPQRATTTGYSTDDATLRLLAHQTPYPVLDALIDYRGRSKLAGTYARGLAASAQRVGGGDRVHTRFNGAGTKTGRLSSSGPNLQNVPREARKAFLASEGMKLVAADYSQIELRVLAQVSGDVSLRAAFQSGVSPHEATLRDVFGLADKGAHPREYTLSKNINFGIPYGAGPEKLVEVAREGGIDLSLQEARELLKKHHAVYPRVWSWIEETRNQALRDGYTDTLQGHRAWYPDVLSPDAGVRGEALRQAVNHVIQGTAGYFTKEAMTMWCLSDTPLVLNVHDELVVEAPTIDAEEYLTALKDLMHDVAQHWLPDVPVEVEGKIGDRWSDLK